MGFYSSRQDLIGSLTKKEFEEDFLNAYTATELAELMKDVERHYLTAAYYEKNIEDSVSYEISVLTDPNKLGEILLYLCENNLINLNA